MEMGGGGKTKGKEEKEVAFRAWDCGSALYDSFELASVYRVLDSHLMALPYHARAPGTTERAPPKRTAATKAKGWRRRKTTAAAAARRKGKAVLHSIIRSVTCCWRL